MPDTSLVLTKLNTYSGSAYENTSILSASKNTL